MPADPPCRDCGAAADYTIQCLHCDLPPERCTHQPMALCFECLLHRTLQTKVMLTLQQVNGIFPSERQN